MSAAVNQLLADLRLARQRSVALAAKFIYLDPHTDAPDDQATMFCSCCGKYGLGGERFFHADDCPVGIVLCESTVRTESHIEYELGGGLHRCLSHEEAAAQGGIARFLVGAR